MSYKSISIFSILLFMLLVVSGVSATTFEETYQESSLIENIAYGDFTYNSMTNPGHGSITFYMHFDNIVNNRDAYRGLESIYYIGNWKFYLLNGKYTGNTGIYNFTLTSREDPNLIVGSGTVLFSMEGVEERDIFTFDYFDYENCPEFTNLVINGENLVISSTSITQGQGGYNSLNYGTTIITKNSNNAIVTIWDHFTARNSLKTYKGTVKAYFNSVWENKVSGEYDLNRMPSTLTIERNGQLSYINISTIDDTLISEDNSATDKSFIINYPEFKYSLVSPSGRIYSKVLEKDYSAVVNKALMKFIYKDTKNGYTINNIIDTTSEYESTVTIKDEWTLLFVIPMSSTNTYKITGNDIFTVETGHVYTISANIYTTLGYYYKQTAIVSFSEVTNLMNLGITGSNQIYYQDILLNNPQGNVLIGSDYLNNDNTVLRFLLFKNDLSSWSNSNEIGNYKVEISESLNANSLQPERRVIFDSNNATEVTYTPIYSKSYVSIKLYGGNFEDYEYSDMSVANIKLNNNIARLWLVPTINVEYWNYKFSYYDNNNNVIYPDRLKSTIRLQVYDSNNTLISDNTENVDYVLESTHGYSLYVGNKYYFTHLITDNFGNGYEVMYNGWDFRDLENFNEFKKDDISNPYIEKVILRKVTVGSDTVKIYPLIRDSLTYETLIGAVINYSIDGSRDNIHTDSGQITINGVKSPALTLINNAHYNLTISMDGYQTVNMRYLVSGSSDLDVGLSALVEQTTNGRIEFVVHERNNNNRIPNAKITVSYMDMSDNIVTKTVTTNNYGLATITDCKKVNQRISYTVNALHYEDYSATENIDMSESLYRIEVYLSDSLVNPKPTPTPNKDDSLINVNKTPTNMKEVVGFGLAKIFGVEKESTMNILIGLGIILFTTCVIAGVTKSGIGIVIGGLTGYIVSVALGLIPLWTLFVGIGIVAIYMVLFYNTSE